MSLPSPSPPPSAVPAPTLAAHNVTFAYGADPVVENVTLALRAGEVLALVGPNGCGKSTLLRLLCGQLQPLTGAITISDPSKNQKFKITNLSAADLARLLALVPQNTFVGFDYTVRQVVLMARWATHPRRGLATALGFETPHDLDLATQAMWTLDVHHLADRPVPQLSGGERQRVVVARALAQQTPIVLLDEPTSSLDLYHQIELLTHLQSLAHEQAKAVLIVTHDLNIALDYADRVILMDRARIVAAGPPKEVLVPESLDAVYQVQTRIAADGSLRFARKT